MSALSSMILMRRSKRTVGLIISCRSFLKVGDTIPLNFMKDSKPIEVKDDKEYPSWLFTLTDPMPTKAQLMAKMESQGPDSLEKSEIMRLMRQITTETIKANNLAAKGSK